MQFNPLSEEQTREESNKPPAYLLKAGEGEYQVTAASTHVKVYDDGTEAESIKLTMRVWDADGKEAQVFDYIRPDGRFAFKFRHACYSCGLGHKYADGKVEPEDFEHKGGRCVIKPEPAKGDYKAKNTIADYIIADRTKETAGYQQAKAEHPAPPRTAAAPTAGSPDAGKRAAWAAYRSDHPGMDLPEQQAAFTEAASTYFAGRDLSAILFRDWQKFIRDKYRAPVGSLKDEVLGGPGIPDDEVPFAACVV